MIGKDWYLLKYFDADQDYKGGNILALLFNIWWKRISYLEREIQSYIYSFNVILKAENDKRCLQ